MSSTFNTTRLLNLVNLGLSTPLLSPKRNNILILHKTGVPSMQSGQFLLLRNPLTIIMGDCSSPS